MIDKAYRDKLRTETAKHTATEGGRVVADVLALLLDSLDEMERDLVASNGLLSEAELAFAPFARGRYEIAVEQSGDDFRIVMTCSASREEAMSLTEILKRSNH